MDDDPSTGEQPISVVGGEATEPAPVPSRRARRAGERRSRRRLFVVLGVVAAVVLVPLLAVGGWFWYQVDPPGDPGHRVTIEVGQGWGVRDIGDELARRGVVGSSFAFQAYVKLVGAGPFRAGTYQLREDLGAQAASDALEQQPGQRYRSLALPPGMTLGEIAARVGTLPGLSAERFLAAASSGQVRSRYQPAGVTSLEGLTWPDTYYVSKDETEVDVLRTLVRQFDTQATKAGLGRAEDPYATVTVASLIQTEAKLDSERPLIAAVVDNRLHDGMPLQIDATVIYAREAAGGAHAGPLTDADFARQSPYNTYRVKGLPPTPISTVSVASLEAALHPADVPYLYYVLIDPSGRHRFATTYAEHQRNVAEARRKGLLG